MRILQSAALALILFLLSTMMLNSCVQKEAGEQPEDLARLQLDAAIEENAELRDHLAYLLHDADQRNAVCVKKLTRGLRNKNPMNIVAMGSNDPWLGQVGKDSIGLAKFATWEHGLRAGYKTLCKYQRKHGVDTLYKLASRYCEGDAMRYAAHLGKAIGIGPHDRVNILEHAAELMKAIIVMENGYNPLPDSYFVAYM